MREPPQYMEEEEEEEEEYWPLNIRFELIEYILRRYGSLQAKDIAQILGCRTEEVRRILRELERSGRVRRAKLGKNYVWTPVEEPHLNFMYY